jgi:hypothetical protein
MVARSQFVAGLIMAFGFATACASEDAMPPPASGLIRGGRGEPTLDQRYGLTITLPMPEAEFVELIERVPLPIHRAGERGLDYPVLRRPRHNRDLDMSTISHGYVIVGGYNSERQRTEHYEAYVDRNGQVVYIENGFAYAP